MEGGGPAAKKPRRLPEVLAHSPQSVGSLFKSKPPLLQQQQLQQLQQQPFQFQPQQERKRSMLAPPVSPQASQIHHFYQQQQIHRIQPIQQPQPQQRRLQGHHLGKKMEDLVAPELSPSEREQSSTANPPWANMLPVSLTMPLHAVSSGYTAIASAAAAAANVGGPVRRMGAKRVPGPDEWRLNSSPGGSVNFMSPPAALASASSPPSFMVSPATYVGPVNVSVAATYTFPHRISSPTPSSSSQCSPNNIARASPPVHNISDPARAAAIERRKLKLKQVAACQQAELQACCQRLLVLQREWREELCSDIREEVFPKQTPEGYSVAV